MKFAWVILLIIDPVLTVTGTADFKVIGLHDPVTAQLGQDVVLPCHLEPPVNVAALTVEWMLNGTLIVNLHRSGWHDQDAVKERFRNRTSLFHDEMVHGNISLRLSNVSYDDAGNYTCKLAHQYNGKPQVKKASVTLTVETQSNSNRTQGEAPYTFFYVGVSFAVVLTVALIVGLIVFLVWKRQQKRQQDNNPPIGGNPQELEDLNAGRDEPDGNNQEDENDQENRGRGESEPLNEPNRQPNDD